MSSTREYIISWDFEHHISISWVIWAFCPYILANFMKILCKISQNPPILSLKIFKSGFYVSVDHILCFLRVKLGVEFIFSTFRVIRASIFNFLDTFGHFWWHVGSMDILSWRPEFFLKISFLCFDLFVIISKAEILRRIHFSHFQSDLSKLF